MTSKTPEVLKMKIAISIPTKYGIIFTQTLKPSFALSIKASKTFIFVNGSLIMGKENQQNHSIADEFTYII